MLIAAIGAMFAFHHAGAQTITNGSLTGPLPTGISQIPSGWIPVNSTVDLAYSDPSFTMLDLFWDIPESSDGGTFLHAITNESFGQLVTGLSIGTTYRISFEQNITSSAVYHPGYADAFVGNEGFWISTFGNETKFSDSMFMPSYEELGSSIWMDQSFTFTATSENQFLTFAGRQGARGALAYADRTDMLIDNIQITAVPEPSAALLGGLGALALVVRRRR